MPEKALTEFWRDLRPIAKVFQPDAFPEAYIHAMCREHYEKVGLGADYVKTLFR